MHPFSGLFFISMATLLQTDLANNANSFIHLRDSLLIVHKLQTTRLQHLTPVEIKSMLAIVLDLDFVRLEVGWLHQRLKEILDAMHLVKHTTTLKEEQKEKKIPHGVDQERVGSTAREGSVD